MIPLLDLDDILNLCRRYQNYDSDQSTLSVHCKVLMGIITADKYGLAGDDFGVHTTLVNPHTFGATEPNQVLEKPKCDYMFDLRDGNGELVLPFTKEHPLILSGIQNDVYDVFPELNCVRTATVGLFSMEYMKKIRKSSFCQRFDKFTVYYTQDRVTRGPATRVVSDATLRQKIIALAQGTYRYRLFEDYRHENDKLMLVPNFRGPDEELPTV